MRQDAAEADHRCGGPTWQESDEKRGNWRWVQNVEVLVCVAAAALRDIHP